MTGPRQVDYLDFADLPAGQENSNKGFSNLQADAYGEMPKAKVEPRPQGDDVSTPESGTTAAQPVESRLLTKVREAQMQARQRRNERETEGLDPMYHNFNYSILDPRSGIEPSWFEQPLTQRILSGMGDTPPNRELPADAFRDENGNLRESIDLHHGDSRLSASVSEGRREDVAELNLLFLKLRTSSEAEFDGLVVDIANRLNVQGRLFRVMELAQKVEDPQTRRGLQFAVLEELLYGSSYLEIASAGVFPSRPETPEDARKRINEMLERIREERRNPRPEQEPPMGPPRPGLSETEQTELAILTAGLWSRNQFLWNIGRAKHDWSH